jgi:hypothetical protein
VAIFLCGLAFCLVSAPFEEQFREGDLVEAVRLTVLLVPALLLAGSGRRSLIGGTLLVGVALVCKWVNHFRPDLAPAWTFLAPGLVFLLFLIGHMLRYILTASRIDSEVMCAGVATYLMLGLVWAFAYILVARLTPDAFAFSTGPAGSQVMKGFTAVYYSFITLCTVGYGDIAPVSGAARMLAMAEAMVGTLYMAVLVARLVSLYSSASTSTHQTDPQP